MRQLTDLSGKRFNRLTVVKLDHKDKNFRCYWLCQCDCGKTVIVRSDCLSSENTKSCGCFKKETEKQRLINCATKHGFHGERLYNIWVNMKDRCTAFGKERGKHYADAGISVCDEWNDYLNFREWSLKNGYSDDLTIDRINPSGNYCPENCRWATILQQQRNRRKSIYLTHNGETHHLKEWAKITGINYHTLYQRYKENDGPEYVLRPHRYLAYKHGGKKI